MIVKVEWECDDRATVILWHNTPYRPRSAALRHRAALRLRRPLPAAPPPLPAAPPPFPLASPPSTAAPPPSSAVLAALTCGPRHPYLRPRRHYLRPRRPHLRPRHHYLQPCRPYLRPPLPLPAAQPPSPAASPHLPAVPAALNCGLAAPYLRPRRPYLQPRRPYLQPRRPSPAALSPLPAAPPPLTCGPCRPHQRPHCPPLQPCRPSLRPRHSLQRRAPPEPPKQLNRPSSRAAQQPCSRAAQQPSRPAAEPPSRPATEQPSRPAAEPPCSRAAEPPYLRASRRSLSLFDLTSGASPAPAADADATVRSQWATRDAAARLAVRRHLPTSERAHFSQYKSAQTLYYAVVARYSSPATAALSRLLLAYLFPNLAAFSTIADLITHLRTSDTRYRAAVPADFCAKNPPPMYITLYYIVTRLPDSLHVVRDHFLSVCPTTLTVDLLKKSLLAAEQSIVAVGASRGDPRTPIFEGCSPSPLLPSVSSVATADLFGLESVGAASASSGRRRSGKGKGGRDTGGALQRTRGYGAIET
ncbi:unnamed protein product [Closterium sp. NIES-54]